ncbi:MAG: ISL3 family transposase [bacterium]|nr:ISL3 family transposase [bacterium]
MTTEDIIEALGGWEGYSIEEMEVHQEEGKVQVWIELTPLPGIARQCSGCGQMVRSIHDVTPRWVRDVAILEAETWLWMERVRVACPNCGPKLEALEWLAPYSRLTRRMAENVVRLCRVLPIKHVAEYLGLSWDTVKSTDKAYLEESLGPVDLSGVEQIVMDEFAIHKGHRYATVIVEASSKRVLWVGRGNGREDIRPFFELLGREGRQRLKAAAMDMNSAYEQETRYQCPFVEIVFDLFHVVAKYGREVIDRVRVDEANRLQDDKPARKVVKSARWLLLRNRENVKPKDRVKLDELLKANRKLSTVYVLKDDLKHLWHYIYEGAARRFWEQWYSRAIRSHIEPLKKFARRLKEYLPGILAHCRWPLHTSLLEGINNKIKVIKRMAYGFRDDDYFFLKIRAAFPGNTG